MKKLWHNFRLAYYTALYRDCLDPKMREKFKKKMTYHKTKLEQTAN